MTPGPRQRLLLKEPEADDLLFYVADGRGALARGVFGGQVIAQALTAATKELPDGKGFKLSSTLR